MREKETEGIELTQNWNRKCKDCTSCPNQSWHRTGMCSTETEIDINLNSGPKTTPLGLNANGALDIDHGAHSP